MSFDPEMGHPGPFRLAVDVGGSHDSLLRRLLARRQDARGIVFDRARSSRRARPLWPPIPLPSGSIGSRATSFRKSRKAATFISLSIILQNGDQGADWLVYNNSRTGSRLGETVILSSACCTYQDGFRLK